MTKNNLVAIALGGNIGDVRARFQTALLMLAAGGLSNIRKASDYQTTPVDCVPGTPDFWNSALIGEWGGTPQELLMLTQSVERRLGRPAQHSSRESRTIDLDILLFGDQRINTPSLTIPHPRMHQREFVLKPLRELLPELSTD